MMVEPLYVFSPRKTVYAGAVAGFITSWYVTVLLIASEYEIGFPLGTFYTVIGEIVGLRGVYALYSGLALHVATSTIVGALSSLLLVTILKHWRLRGKVCIVCSYRAAGVGLILGFIIWLVLFLPVTFLIVKPSLAFRAVSDVSMLYSTPVSVNALLGMVWSITISALPYHLGYGATLGYLMSKLVKRIAIVSSKNI
ncbi:MULTISPECIES: hypothetical protein [Candidatus Nitrosocaldus]|jgi:hypothetical protein|uniref:Uncharacterized protein n=1 Tax=Candidatus Nitrosocaldus cavascurensis TaxID=2058097 RepID=A0A2K5ASL5_9ARCH|nr:MULTISPECIES: hypothetical protein [Candidatus Nitrosocaldus]SPC34599.1 conserved membrane protein of unknown function [Candidatus Nitrosocaldus cavascurensis]